MPVVGLGSTCEPRLSTAEFRVHALTHATAALRCTHEPLSYRKHRKEEGAVVGKASWESKSRVCCEVAHIRLGRIPLATKH